MEEYKQDLESLINSFEKLADHYQVATNTFSHAIGRFCLRENILEELRRISVSTVLDAGGGTGLWSMLLASLGYDVTLVDISPRSIEIAKQETKEKKLPPVPRYPKKDK